MSQGFPDFYKQSLNTNRVVPVSNVPMVTTQSQQKMQAGARPTIEQLQAVMAKGSMKPVGSQHPQHPPQSQQSQNMSCTNGRQDIEMTRRHALIPTTTAIPMDASPIATNGNERFLIHSASVANHMRVMPNINTNESQSFDDRIPIYNNQSRNLNQQLSPYQQQVLLQQSNNPNNGVPSSVRASYIMNNQNNICSQPQIQFTQPESINMSQSGGSSLNGASQVVSDSFLLSQLAARLETAGFGRTGISQSQQQSQYLQQNNKKDEPTRSNAYPIEHLPLLPELMCIKQASSNEFDMPVSASPSPRPIVIEEIDTVALGNNKKIKNKSTDMPIIFKKPISCINSSKDSGSEFSSDESTSKKITKKNVIRSSNCRGRGRGGSRRGRSKSNVGINATNHSNSTPQTYNTPTLTTLQTNQLRESIKKDMLLELGKLIKTELSDIKLTIKKSLAEAIAQIPNLIDVPIPETLPTKGAKFSTASKSKRNNKATVENSSIKSDICNSSCKISYEIDEDAWWSEDIKLELRETDDNLEPALIPITRQFSSINDDSHMKTDDNNDTMSPCLIQSSFVEQLNGTKTLPSSLYHLKSNPTTNCQKSPVRRLCLRRMWRNDSSEHDTFLAMGLK